MNRITNTIAMTAVVAATVGAGHAQEGSKRMMTACLIDHRRDAYRTPQIAEQVASRIFAAAGLELEWRHGKPHTAPDLASLTFVIELTDQTPSDYKPGVLAFATPYEGIHIRVFYDRVAMMDKLYPDAILGHVLAHEITHLLEGLDRHSKTGVLKANYTQGDVAAMWKRPMALAEEDVFLIQLGVTRRLAVRGETTSAVAGEIR